MRKHWKEEKFIFPSILLLFPLIFLFSALLSHITSHQLWPTFFLFELRHNIALQMSHRKEKHFVTFISFKYPFSETRLPKLTFILCELISRITFVCSSIFRLLFLLRNECIIHGCVGGRRQAYLHKMSVLRSVWFSSSVVKLMSGFHKQLTRGGKTVILILCWWTKKHESFNLPFNKQHFI